MLYKVITRFGSDVALTLNNLGILFRKQKKYEMSFSYYSESLDIYKKLCEYNSDLFSSDVAWTLGLIANLHLDTRNNFV